MGTALDELIELLARGKLEVTLSRGLSPDENRQRVFGGQVAGQALVAAGRTVDRGRVHSLHAYFLRPGDPAVPIVYEVDRIRDGRSFTTRRVVGIQHGQAILNLSASFHVDEPGTSPSRWCRRGCYGRSGEEVDVDGRPDGPPGRRRRRMWWRRRCRSAFR